MSKDLITGEIAVAIHLLEPTIIVSTCVVAALYWQAAARQWLPTSTRGCCVWLLLWDRVASLPQIVMTTAWQLGFLRLPAAITMEWLSKISHRYLLECYILFFTSY